MIRILLTVTHGNPEGCELVASFNAIIHATLRQKQTIMLRRYLWSAVARRMSMYITNARKYMLQCSAVTRLTGFRH